MGQLTYSHDAFEGLIGVARRDITPPIGIYNRNWGAATTEVATGIHRPLTLTALALLRDAVDSKPLVLLSLDLGWWRTWEDEWEVRSALIDGLGVDERCVLLHLTHTHSAPSICREDADRPGGDLVGPYLDHVIASGVETAREAVRNSAPGTLTWAYGRCELARNRDLPDPVADRIVCGFNPGQPGDDTLLVGRATDAHDRIVATLVNYAMHPVTLAWQNTLISPDFVGAMRDVVEAYTSDAPCLFLQGASGELAPMEEYTGDTGIADKNGRALGLAALAVLESMLPPGRRLCYDGVVESGAPLATWSMYETRPPNRLDASVIEFDIALKPDLPSLDEIDTGLTTATEPYMIERLRRRRRLRRAVGEGTQSRQKAWIWRIGDALVVANPNEAYSPLQLELRQRFQGRAIAVMNITNGGYAYLPARGMYDRDQYQVWQTPYAAGCLEQLIDVCAQAIGRMAP
jgi:hypothetical protein